VDKKDKMIVFASHRVEHGRNLPRPQFFDEKEIYKLADYLSRGYAPTTQNQFQKGLGVWMDVWYC